MAHLPVIIWTWEDLSITSRINKNITGKKLIEEYRILLMESGITPDERYFP